MLGNQFVFVNKTILVLVLYLAFAFESCLANWESCFWHRKFRQFSIRNYYL